MKMKHERQRSQDVFDLGIIAENIISFLDFLCAMRSLYSTREHDKRLFNTLAEWDWTKWNKRNANI